MVGGSLMVHKGDVIYVTNTKCRIFLDHVDIKQEEAQKALIRVSGNSASRGWGKLVSMEEMLSLRPRTRLFPAAL